MQDGSPETLGVQALQTLLSQAIDGDDTRGTLAVCEALLGEGLDSAVLARDVLLPHFVPSSQALPVAVAVMAGTGCGMDELSFVGVPVCILWPICI